jgi:hypothetical protein
VTNISDQEFVALGFDDAVDRTDDLMREGKYAEAERLKTLYWRAHKKNVMDPGHLGLSAAPLRRPGFDSSFRCASPRGP